MSDETTTTLRHCIGSARFGIQPHEVAIEGFPRQPSQRDGLGRMCKVHWNQYTAGLARNAKARKAASADVTPTDAQAAPSVTATRPLKHPRRPAAVAKTGAKGHAG
ncbi:MAG: hypothetical protein ACLQBX_07760 [Candidatus Limnocylindrales bacterium]